MLSEHHQAIQCISTRASPHGSMDQVISVKLGGLTGPPTDGCFALYLFDERPSGCASFPIKGPGSVRPRKSLLISHTRTLPCTKEWPCILEASCCHCGYAPFSSWGISWSMQLFRLCLKYQAQCIPALQVFGSSFKSSRRTDGSLYIGFTRSMGQLSVWGPMRYHSPALTQSERSMLLGVAATIRLNFTRSSSK